MEKINIDGETLYISGLGNIEEYQFMDNGLGDLLHFDTLTGALKPIVKMGKMLKRGLREVQPDEVEVTLQLQLAVSNQEIAFAMVNAEAEAHLGLKFVWKKEELNSGE